MAEEFSSIALPTSISIDRIDDRTTTAELKKIFARFGRIVEIGIRESSENPNSTTIAATVTFRDPAAAKHAAREMDGLEVRGVPIGVSVVGP